MFDCKLNFLQFNKVVQQINKKQNETKIIYLIENIIFVLLSFVSREKLCAVVLMKHTL